MAQEITIVVVIDTVGALKAGRLDGNIYLIDNLKTEGSKGCGSGDLVSAVNGTCWQDGSQANELLLNWLVTGVGSLPPSLPRTFQARQSRRHEAKRIEALTTAVERLKGTAPVDGEQSPGIHHAGHRTRIRRADGTTHEGAHLLSLRGEVFRAGGEADLSQLVPSLIDLTGEAVDQGILYPAQYGTPVPIHDGWYWSATASAHRPGIYRYTMHFRLYELCWIGGEPQWEPRDMTYEARLQIRQRPMVNGFTGAAVGLLPITGQPSDIQQGKGAVER